MIKNKNMNYILQKDFNWFGEIIPRGTIYYQLKNKDIYRPRINGNDCPHKDLTFMTVLNSDYFIISENNKF